MTYFRSFICILLMLPCFANAGLRTYSIDQPDLFFSGGFTFDDTTMLFSNVNILDTSSGFGEQWTSALGNALSLSSIGANYGALIDVFFGVALGTEIQGTSIASTYSGSSALGTFNGTFAVSSAVPTPATLALFGLGLAGLGWSRRKKA